MVTSFGQMIQTSSEQWYTYMYYAFLKVIMRKKMNSGKKLIKMSVHYIWFKYPQYPPFYTFSLLTRYLISWDVWRKFICTVLSCMDWYWQTIGSSFIYINGNRGFFVSYSLFQKLCPVLSIVSNHKTITSRQPRKLDLSFIRGII